MKKLYFLFAFLISTVSYGQLIPKGFAVITINDVDSALVILSKAANQQRKMPASVEITKEYINQSKTIDRYNTFTMKSIRSGLIPNMIYYENITKVYVRKGWDIHFISSITAQKDLFVIFDKRMAEDAFAALMCLIKNSGNKHYENIISEISK